MSAERERLLEKLHDQTGELARLHLANTHLHEVLDDKQAYIASLEAERDRLKVCIDYAAKRAFDAGV